MAYAFKRIEDALNQPSESNIFGNQDQTSNVVQNQPNQSGVKTSTSGDLGASNQAGSSNQKMDYNPDYSSDADVLKMNVGKTSTANTGVQKIGDQIAQNKQTLQDRADQYMQGVKDQNQYDVSDDTLTGAILGDEDAYKSVSSTLNKQQANYRPEFEGAEDLAVKDVDLLQNQAGIQKLASRGQGPRYTAGMGAFDAALMQRDPEFQRLVAETRGANRELENQLGTMPDELEAQAQEYGVTALTDAQSTADQFLKNYQTGLREQNEAELKAFVEQLKNLDRKAIGQQAVDDALAAIMPDLEREARGAKLDKFLDQGLAGSDYIDFMDPESLSYQDFLDEEEADQFNRIQQLLGGTHVYIAGGLPTAEDMYGIDRSSLESTLFNEIMGDRSAENIRQENRIRDILSRTSDRAGVLNQRIQGMRDTYQDDLRDLARQIIYQNPQYQQVYNEGMLAGYGGPTIEDLTVDDILTQGEVNVLNVALRDMGLEPIYQAGEYEIPESLIDAQDFERYLLEQLEPAYQDWLSQQPREPAPYERELTGQGAAMEEAKDSLDYYRRRNAERSGDLAGGGSPFQRIARSIRGI